MNFTKNNISVNVFKTLKIEDVFLLVNKPRIRKP